MKHHGGCSTPFHHSQHPPPDFDNRAVPRYADRRSCELGVLFTARMGNVDLDRPVGEWLGSAWGEMCCAHGDRVGSKATLGIGGVLATGDGCREGASGRC